MLGNDFEVVCNQVTDTSIYSVQKIFSLLSNCNPNTIEMLGGTLDSYLYLSEAGQLLLDNRHLFLSQKAIASFGGYANQQLRRLENFSNQVQSQEKQEEHILKTIQHMDHYLSEKYHIPKIGMKLYLDKAKTENLDKEIFCDISLQHFPLRDYNNIMQEMNAIISAYNKVGKRNQNAKSHAKLAKHMMHLVRLYYMCFDILEKEEIITYRKKEHDELMAIRNGKYLNTNENPVPEFYEMVDELEKHLVYATKHTNLPKTPDFDKINDLKCTIIEDILRKSFQDREEKQTEIELD